MRRRHPRARRAGRRGKLERRRSCAIIKALAAGAADHRGSVDAQQHDAVVIGIDNPDMGRAGEYGLGFVEGVGRAAALAAAEHAELVVAAIEQLVAVARSGAPVMSFWPPSR